MALRGLFASKKAREAMRRREEEEEGRDRRALEGLTEEERLVGGEMVRRYWGGMEEGL